MRNNLVAPLTLLLTMALILPALSQPSTNEQIVIDAVRSQVDKGISPDSDGALVVISGATDLEMLVSGAIADAMREKYSQVMLASAPAPSADNLTFAIQGFDFSYRNGGSRGFLKARKISRELRGQLRITIKSGTDGKLREVEDILISYNDSIDPGWAKYVNSPNIALLAPPVPPSKWTKYIEPALVVSAVGALVYLFFANR